MTKQSRYIRIIERIFSDKHTPRAEVVEFERNDIVRAAHDLGLQLPKNLGDLIYSFRYRASLPDSITSHAPEGTEWVIMPRGTAKYAFIATAFSRIKPNTLLVTVKIPDATPGVIRRYTLSDEQALLAVIRYNRLIDIFTGVTCYALQSHLRTTVPEMGQVETDEIYIGIDRRGAHHVFPVQAKGGNDNIGLVQIEQDFALCRSKFPELECRPIAAQFMADNLIALFAFGREEEEIRLLSERHYRLVDADTLSSEDLLNYRHALMDS